MTTVRRVFVGLMQGLLVAGLGLAAVGAAASDVTLRLHTFNSPKAIAVRNFIKPWAKEVADRSQGRIEVEVYPSMQLGGKPSELYGQARDGVVDIIWTLPGYTFGRFPLTEVFELPFVCGDAVATSQALTEFHDKWLRDEYGDTHPLVFHSTAPGHLHTTERPVRTIDDLQGMKIRIASRSSAEMIKALGGVPIGMPVPKVYEALARGVVEGAWLPWTIMRPFRVHEVTQYHTEISLFCGLFVMTMNKPRYDSLPEDLRAVIDDTTGMTLAKRLGRLWQDDEAPGRAIALEQGDQVIALSEAQRKLWRERTSPVIDAWVDKVTELGYDGDAMLADARRLVAKYRDAPDD